MAMPDNDQIQIVAVLPGGLFFGLGLIELENVDALIACLASLDMRSGHPVSPIDLKAAYEQAKAAKASLDANRLARGINNDADDDGA